MPSRFTHTAIPNRIRLGRSVLLLALLSALPVLSSANESTPPDFSVWQRLPVFHDGRMMPLNTFSRQIVETVCDRANPRLNLDGVSDQAKALPAFSETEKMFPDEVRKFTAPELLFSWMVEPQRWQFVPFLIAEHESLREDILGPTRPVT